jgi:hypothetical protein
MPNVEEYDDLIVFSAAVWSLGESLEGIVV